MSIETIEEFEARVARHDLTFEYSDDGDCWRRGSADLHEITCAAKKFPREQVVEIWNRHVDKKLIEGSREPFYWKD